MHGGCPGPRLWRVCGVWCRSMPGTHLLWRYPDAHRGGLDPAITPLGSRPSHMLDADQPRLS